MRTASAAAVPEANALDYIRGSEHRLTEACEEVAHRYGTAPLRRDDVQLCTEDQQCAGRIEPRVAVREITADRRGVADTHVGDFGRHLRKDGRDIPHERVASTRRCVTSAPIARPPSWRSIRSSPSIRRRSTRVPKENSPRRRTIWSAVPPPRTVASPSASRRAAQASSSVTGESIRATLIRPQAAGHAQGNSNQRSSPKCPPYAPACSAGPAATRSPPDVPVWRRGDPLLVPDHRLAHAVQDRSPRPRHPRVRLSREM